MGIQNTTVARNVGGTGALGSSRYAGRAAAVAIAYSRILPRSIGMIVIGSSSGVSGIGAGELKILSLIVS